jgi:GTP-sensing pleiotropic transcriptional regulator CodY
MPGKRANVPAEDAEDQVTLELTEDDLLSFVHEQVISAERHPGEFTAGELADREGSTRDVIYGILVKAEKAGKVSRRAAIIGGTRGYYWRMVR